MRSIGLAHRATKPISLLAITLFFAASVSAYTVVMRGGRRIEIPSRFVVTNSTLTYEVSPGVQVTLALAAIDISATEKVNSERPGSLLARGNPDPLLLNRPSRPALTITNRDLEPMTKRRQESEAAYEVKRKQLGLPTLAESRRRAAVVPDLSGSELEQQLISDREAEAYWRARAEALRTEMAALDSELAYLRARLEELPQNSFTGYSFSTLVPLLSFGNAGRAPFSHQQGPRHNGVFSTPRAIAPFSGRVRFGGGAVRGQVSLNRGDVSRPRPYGARHPQYPFAAPVGLVGSSYDYSFERSALITQFNELGAARAGLNARWRALEDEARRAGASPGWLRP